MIVFDDQIADILSDNILLIYYLLDKKLNVSLVVTTQSCFTGPKNIRPDSTHYFVLKTPTKRELQQIAFNISSDINSQVSTLWIFIKNILHLQALISAYF